MSDKEATTRIVGGRPLKCPICGHNRFHSRAYLLNTRAATFFNFDWANRSATTYVCETCGHILWFVEPERDAS